MRESSAIPGSYNNGKGGKPGRGDARHADPAAVFAAIRSVRDGVSETGWLDFAAPPPLRAEMRWEDGAPILHLWVRWDLTKRSGQDQLVTWRWQWIHSIDDWDDYGWHPDDMYNAIAEPWRTRLWRALNPGKGPAPY